MHKKRGFWGYSSTIIILLLPIVYSFGLASDYLENDTVKLAPGANYEYHINIQNTQPEPLSVNITIDNKENIAHFKNNNATFVIPPKSYDEQIPLIISIPWNIPEGKGYEISYRATPVAAAQGGGMQFVTPLSRGFKVKVVKDGFIARGVINPPPLTFSQITTSAIKTLSAAPVKISSTVLLALTAALLLALVWKRSGMLSEKLLGTTETETLSYSTLPEFYYLMSSVDDETFVDYLTTYSKEVFTWLSSVAGEENARHVWSSKTRDEFLQRLEHALP